MRNSILLGLGLLLVPHESDAQAARHATEPTMLVTRANGSARTSTQRMLYRRVGKGV
jgi:hypothetical protein